MEEQQFKLNKTKWRILLFFYLAVSITYTIIVHDSVIRMDVVFMNPLLGPLFYYVICSRQVYIDSQYYRYKYLGLSFTKVPLGAVQSVEIKPLLLGARVLEIAYATEAGKTKKMYLPGEFDLEGIQERLMASSQ